jgi:hypothetical protein
LCDIPSLDFVTPFVFSSHTQTLHHIFHGLEQTEKIRKNNRLTFWKKGRVTKRESSASSRSFSKCMRIIAVHEIPSSFLHPGILSAIFSSFSSA